MGSISTLYLVIGNILYTTTQGEYAQHTCVKKLWRINTSTLGLCIYSTHRFIPYNTEKTIMTTSNINRSVLYQIFLTFRAIFYRKQPRLVGIDKSGNRYFEAPPNKKSEHTHLSKLPKRFFLIPGQKGLEYAHGNNHVEMSSIPAEWYSWLSHRRSNPPTEEEIEANTISKENRLIRAAESQMKHNEERREMIKQGLLNPGKTDPSKIQNKLSFPVYDDLEISPDENIKPQLQKK
ncbi:hypothetical protein MN116_006553 [Schistosoma mekongi]|uniref:NADH dehydrogenase [ubiquinone] 1 alpha subcomplex subunit 12 n=1 Tax=Schistosoma mekongi TaxID=38744 RepID=A0AAE1Z8I4_SCHME|nr:hypothetical protein MN116_006553 [Schistosoma mekongi]